MKTPKFTKSGPGRKHVQGRRYLGVLGPFSINFFDRMVARVGRKAADKLWGEGTREIKDEA